MSTTNNNNNKSIINRFRNSFKLKRNKQSEHRNSVNKCASLSFAHKWTISTVARFYEQTHKWKSWPICSRYFSPSPNNQIDFGLQLYPHGYDDYHRDFISIGIGVCDLRGLDGQFKGQVKVTVLDSTSGKELYFAEINPLDMYGFECILMKEFIRRDELFDSNKQYLQNDKLVLLFEFTLTAKEAIFNQIPTQTQILESESDGCANIVEVNHTWKIDNFADLFRANAVLPWYFKSSSFPAKSNQSFHLRIYPNEYNTTQKANYLNIGLVNDHCEDAVTVHFDIRLIGTLTEQFKKEYTTKINAQQKINFSLINRKEFEKNLKRFKPAKGQHKLVCKISYMLDKGESAGISQTNESESVLNVAQKLVHSAQYKWTIEQFRTLFGESNQEPTISRLFFSPSLANHHFYLELWPNGDDGGEYLSLYVCFDEFEEENVYLQIRASICNLATSDSKEATKSVIRGDQKCGWSKFIKRDLLLQDDNLVHDDKLVILCELWIIQNGKCRKRNKYLAKLSRQFGGNKVSPANIFYLTDSTIQNAILNVNSRIRFRDVTLTHGQIIDNQNNNAN